DELLVARRAVLRLLEHRLREALDVLLRVGADEEVAHETPAGTSRLVELDLADVAVGRMHGVLRVAADVGLADGVAGEARDPFLIALQAGQLALVRGDVLRAREQRDRIVAAGAVARGRRSVLPRHRELDRLERLVHRRVAVRRRQPLGDDLRVTAGRAASPRPGEQPRI